MQRAEIVTDERARPRSFCDVPVDPEIDVVRVHRRGEDRFGRPAELPRDAGDALTTTLLPGLEISLATLFAQ